MSISTLSEPSHLVSGSFLMCDCSQSDKVCTNKLTSARAALCYTAGVLLRSLVQSRFISGASMGQRLFFMVHLDVTTQVWRVRICYENNGHSVPAVFSLQRKVPGTFNLLAQTQPEHTGSPQSFERQGSLRSSSYCHHIWLARRMEFSKSLVNRLNKVDASTEFSRSLLSGISWC